MVDVRPRLPARFGRSLSVALTAAALAACSASGDGDSGGFGGSGNSGGGGAGAASSSGPGAGGSGGVVFGTGGGGQGGGPVDAEVFAHSADTLYRLDPLTKEVTVVGAFSGCSNAVIDIAIDEAGVMFGTTFGGLYRIDKLTATCAFIASGSYPNSLSFVPRGTIDPNLEVLVGYEGATYTRIDTVTGAKSAIGSLGGGYASSGDIVSVIGGGTYLTVNGNGCGDCIVRVDPTTGALVQNIGPLNRASVFGLAFWGGSAYGFNAAGALFQIDLATAAATDIPMPSAPPGLSFYGAGSTTAAPLMPPE